MLFIFDHVSKFHYTMSIFEGSQCDGNEFFLSKFLGEYICNLLICVVVLQNNCPFMHQLPDVVHMDLNVFVSLSLNRIY